MMGLLRRMFPRPATVPAPVAPEPPDDVVVLDGHWWKNTGREDYSHLPPEKQVYARSIYVCQRCSQECLAWGTPPRLWEIQNIRTGEVVESGPADTHRHVAVKCDVEREPND